MTETLIRPDGSALTYDRFVPDKPAKAAVVFMHGFQSDRNATKAVFMDAVCRKAAIPYIRFDFYAHGPTDIPWPQFTIGRAVEDALLVIDHLTHGPVILMGSSMGGWVGLRVMEERQNRVCGLVFVAPAPDFTVKIAQTRPLSAETAQKYTNNLLDQAKNELVLQKNWRFEGPVAILQGKMDESVPWEMALKIQEKFPQPDKVSLTLIDDGDHRLNRPEDLALLEKAFFEVYNKAQ